MADTNNRQFSVMVDNGGVLSYPQNFITANSVATKIDLANKQDKLTFVEENASIGDLYLGVVSSANAYITLTQDGGIMGINSPVLTITSVNPIKIDSDEGFEGSGIATSIGTSETSAKLPTEGAVVKALKNVSGGSTPDLSNYLKKSGDASLELGNSSVDGSLILKPSISDHPFTHSTITPGEAVISWIDEGKTKIHAGSISLYLVNDNSEAPVLSMSCYAGFGGNYVSKEINDETAELSGAVPTTGAVKTYVDNKVGSGGSAPSNMVTTDTEQTITGDKTFTGAVNINSQEFLNIRTSDNISIYGTEVTLANVDGSYFSTIGNEANVSASGDVFITSGNSGNVGTSIVLNSTDVISLLADEQVIIGTSKANKNTSIKINGTIDTTSKAIATTIGTSETSAKLPTEGAIVKALKNVSGGSAPDLSNYLKKSGDTTLSLGILGTQQGSIKIFSDYEWAGSPTTLDYSGLSICVPDEGWGYYTGSGINIKKVAGELSIDAYSGFSGDTVDTSIPSTPEDGHIATTGAIKTYVDNKVASGGSAPSNMVTTDTEQTITGRKTFEAETGVYKLTQYSRMADGDSDTSSIQLGYNYTEINAKNEGIFINSDNVTFGDNSNNLGMGNIGKQMLTIQPNEIIFGVPYVQRVYSPNTYKWTETLKYTYLSKDVNGNVTFAIADSLPKEVSFGVSTNAGAGLTSSTSSVTVSIFQKINNEGEDQFDFSQGFETGIQVKFVVNNDSSFESSSNIYSDYLTASSKDVRQYVEMTYLVAIKIYENITIAGQTLDVSSIWPTSVPRIYCKFIVYRNGELLAESKSIQIRR